MTSPYECRAMTGPDRFDVLRFMGQFRPDEVALGRALALFVEREDLGLVWLAWREDTLVGCCSVGYSLATSAGGIVAVVRDLYVDPRARRTGVATALLESLAARLTAAEVAATAVVTGTSVDLPAFLATRGFALTGAVFTAGSAPTR